jgi:hypothetical protein
VDIDPKHQVPVAMGEVLRVYRVATTTLVGRAFLVGTIAFFLVWLGAEYLNARAEGRELLQKPLRLVMAIAAFSALVWQARELVRGLVARVWLTEEGIHVRDLRTKVSICWSEVRSVRFEVWRSTIETLIFETADGNLRLPNDLKHILELLKEARDRGLVAVQGLPQPVLIALDHMTTTSPSNRAS